MDIVIILLGSIMFAFLFCILRILFQMIEYEVSSKSKSSILRKNPPQSKKNNSVRLPVDNFSRIMEPTFPESLAIQKLILLNLNIMECQLSKMEKFLSTGETHAHSKSRKKRTVRFQLDSDSESN